MRKLTLSEYFLFFKVFILAITARALLKIIPFKKIIFILNKILILHRVRPCPDAPDKKFEKVIAKLKLKQPKVLNCFSISIAMWYFLKKEGYPVNIVVGLRKDELGMLKGHSWLYMNKEPYLIDENMVSLYTIFKFNIVYE